MDLYLPTLFLLLKPLTPMILNHQHEFNSLPVQTFPLFHSLAMFVYSTVNSPTVTGLLKLSAQLLQY